MFTLQDVISFCILESECSQKSYRAGTLHLQGTINHVIDNLFHSFRFFFVLTVEHDTGMEVSITNVSEDSSKQI